MISSKGINFVETKLGDDRGNVDKDAATLNLMRCISALLGRAISMKWDRNSQDAFFEMLAKANNRENEMQGLSDSGNDVVTAVAPKAKSIEAVKSNAFYKRLRECLSFSSELKPTLAISVCASEIISRLARLGYIFRDLFDVEAELSREWMVLVLVRKM
jgi:hypothetical protein